MSVRYTATGYLPACISVVAGMLSACLLVTASYASNALPGVADSMSAGLRQALKLPSDPVLHEGDILRPAYTGRRAIGWSTAGRLWVDGIIPYQIDPALSKHSMVAIEKAISHWNQVSGISFVPLDDVIKAKGASNDSVFFKKNKGCASWVGRQGGQQQVWVGENCSMGSMMHEIGHVLGLEHEHTRADRDQYISIHWANIQPDKTHNFDVAGEGSRMLGSYDYESIMHYGPFNFTQSGEPTITPLFGQRGRIGQRVAPSPGDLNAVAQLYAADISVVAHLYSDESGQEAAVHVANNRTQGAHNIEVRVSIEASSVLAHSYNGWSCDTASELQLLCTLDRLPGNATSVLSLTIDPSESVSAFEAVVSSKTPDVDLQNNSNWSGIDQSISLPEPQAEAARPQDDETGSVMGGALSGLWMLIGLLIVRRKS